MSYEERPLSFAFAFVVLMAFGISAGFVLAALYLLVTK